MEIVEFHSDQDPGRLASMIRDTFVAAYSIDMDPSHLAYHLQTQLSDQAVADMLKTDSFYLAVRGEQWLGFIQIGWQAKCGDVDLAAEDVLIHRVYVVPSAQSQGIGTALLQYVLNDTRARHVLAVWYENYGAQALYHRFGFRQVGERPEQDHRGEYSGKDLILRRDPAAITLRRLQSSDLTAFQAYRTDPELSRYQGWDVQSDAESLQFITTMASIEQWQSEVWFQIAICDQQNTVIGDIGLCLHNNRTLELGCTLHQKDHGKGVAHDAVYMALSWAHNEVRERGLPVSEFVAFTHEQNVAAIGLLRRLNFHQQEQPVDQEYRFYLPLGEFKPFAYNYQNN